MANLSPVVPMQTQEDINNNNNIAVSSKRKSSEIDTTQEINIDNDTNEHGHLQKKIHYSDNDNVIKQALPMDSVVDSEAIKIIKSLLISANNANESSHPVCDFLTEPIVSLLLELMGGSTEGNPGKRGSLKQGIYVFYGTGCNGKSCFTKILQNMFRCKTVSSDIFC